VTPPRAGDPWAHRRGEPRVFAFLWTCYVLLAVAGSIAWASRFAALTTALGPAARIMLVVVAVGATILWPMVRLCQASPARDAPAHVLVDVLVVLAPVQLVLWPLAVLASWPLGIVGAIAALLSAWIALVGGILAIALGGRPAGRPGDPILLARSAWMLAILALVGAAPLMLLFLAVWGHAPPPWLRLLSPLTAVPALTGAGIAGPQAPLSPSDWSAIACPLGLGVVAWVLASVRSMLGRRGERAGMLPAEP